MTWASTAQGEGVTTLPRKTINLEVRERLLLLLGQREVLVLLLFLLLSTVLALRTPTFLSPQNLFNMARAFSWIAIVAVGESAVILTGGIDLSVGSVMALAGIVAGVAMHAGWSVVPAIALALTTGVAVGYANGVLVGRVGLPPFIVTLGTMSLARGVIFGLSGGWPARDFPPEFRVLGQGNVFVLGLAVPVPVIIMIVFVLISAFLLNMTVMGRYVRLLGRSEPALRVSGVSIESLKQFVYVFAAFTAAVGGILMTARLGVAAPTAAVGYEIDIIAAAILGGASLVHGGGNVWGVLLGAALLQVIRSGLVLLGVHPYWQTAFVGAILLVAIFIDYMSQRPE